MAYFKSFDVALHDNLVKKPSTIQNPFTCIKCSANQLAATSACFYSLLMGYLMASKELTQFNVFISDLEENINSLLITLQMTPKLLERKEEREQNNIRLFNTVLQILSLKPVFKNRMSLNVEERYHPLSVYSGTLRSL